MLKKIIKFFIIILIVVLVISVILIKSFDLYLNNYSSKLISPDREYYIHVIENNGGATTGFVTSVVIYNVKSYLMGSRLLTVWSGNSSNVFASNGSMNSIKVSWLSSKKMKISIYDCDKIYKQYNSWRDIKIIYDEICTE